MSARVYLAQGIRGCPDSISCLFALSHFAGWKLH